MKLTEDGNWMCNICPEPISGKSPNVYTKLTFLQHCMMMTTETSFVVAPIQGVRLSVRVKPLLCSRDSPVAKPVGLTLFTQSARVLVGSSLSMEYNRNCSIDSVLQSVELPVVVVGKLTTDGKILNVSHVEKK